MLTIPRVMTALSLIAVLGVAGAAAAQSIPPTGRLMAAADVTQVFGRDVQGYCRVQDPDEAVMEFGDDAYEVYDPETVYFCLFTEPDESTAGWELTIAIHPDASFDGTLMDWIEEGYGPLEYVDHVDAMPDVGDEAQLLYNEDIFESTLAFHTGATNIGITVGSMSDGSEAAAETAAARQQLADLGRLIAARLAEAPDPQSSPGGIANTQEVPGESAAPLAAESMWDWDPNEQAEISEGDLPLATASDAPLDGEPAPGVDVILMPPDAAPDMTDEEIQAIIDHPFDICSLVSDEEWAGHWAGGPTAAPIRLEGGDACGWMTVGDQVRMAIELMPADPDVPIFDVSMPPVTEVGGLGDAAGWVEHWPIPESSTLVVRRGARALVIEMSARDTTSTSELLDAARTFAGFALARLP